MLVLLLVCIHHFAQPQQLELQIGIAWEAVVIGVKRYVFARFDLS
jgi:hypothetical protein